jgi:hypothetical protein
VDRAIPFSFGTHIASSFWPSAAIHACGSAQHIPQLHHKESMQWIP